MRITPPKKPAKELRKTAARLLRIQTIDQMHYRHGWVPDIHCRDCSAFIKNTCRNFYGKKRVAISRMVRWSAKYIACGLFRKDGEPILRTLVRKATALAAGEISERAQAQKGLFE